MFVFVSFVMLGMHTPTHLHDFKKRTANRQWWLEHRFKCGDKWQGSDWVFIQDNGKPIAPNTLNFWLNQLIKQNNLEHFTPHSLRHTFSTLQIMSGVNIRTLQARTGHAQASTLTNIYAHAIKTADEMATEALDDMLTPKALKMKVLSRQQA